MSVLFAICFFCIRFSSNYWNREENRVKILKRFIINDSILSSKGFYFRCEVESKL